MRGENKENKKNEEKRGKTMIVGIINKNFLKLNEEKGKKPCI